MVIRERLKYFFARLVLRKTILFSRNDGWEQQIRDRIKGYAPFFHEFNEVNPNDFDLVVPLTLHAQKYINALPGRLIEQKALVPSNTSIDLCNDKERFQSFLVNNGLEKLTPRTNEKFCYPYILKKKIDEWGVNTVIISDPEIERAHASEIASGDYFTQEYIEGQDEYTAHVIFNGEYVEFLRVLKFTYPDRFFVKGKHYQNTSVVEVDHGRFKGIFEDILVKVGYQGICCFNYKVLDNDMKIFEINPRYGASLTHSINEALISYQSVLSNRRLIRTDKR